MILLRYERVYESEVTTLSSPILHKKFKKYLSEHFDTGVKGVVSCQYGFNMVLRNGFNMVLIQYRKTIYHNHRTILSTG